MSRTNPIDPVTSIIWPLVIVGRGSSAAYYCTSIDVTLYANVLAVGEDDPWAGKRGHSGKEGDATLKINHPLHLLQHLKNTAPPYRKELVDRCQWAQMNAAALAECNVQILQATVKGVADANLPENLSIDGTLGPYGFCVELKDGRKIYAYKVVYAAGTGGHRVPTELKELRKAYPNQVLDLDEFASLPSHKLTPSTEVIIIGSNAAIDAPHKCLRYSCKMNWLIDLPHPQAPPILETQPAMKAAWKHPEKHKLNVMRYKSYKGGTRTGQQVSLTVTFQAPPEKVNHDHVKTGPKPPEGGTQIVRGDYITYGVGPDGSTEKAIHPDLTAKLKPILDSSQALSNKKGSAPAILGYEAEGTGLYRGFEVVGAISASIARAVAVGSDGSRARKPSLAAQIGVLRKDKEVFLAITNSDFKETPTFAKDLTVIEGMDRAALVEALRIESKAMTERHSAQQKNLKFALERLGDLILAYHASATFARMGENDPFNDFGKKYRERLNMQAANLPKGAVADSGQLTSILTSMGALATVRGRLPKYIPKQTYTASATKGDFAKVDQTGGGKPENINVQVEDAQNIALYIALVFPHVQGSRLNSLMDGLMGDRHESGDGITNERIAKFWHDVDKAEAEGLIEDVKKSQVAK